MFQFGGLPPLDEWREPPRPSLSPVANRGGMERTFSTEDGEPGEVNTIFGQDLTRTIRFVSTESLGFLTWEEAQRLTLLYNNGGSFILVTDLLVPLGQPAESYRCRFVDPPVFTLVNPQRQLYYMDILLRMEL